MIEEKYREDRPADPCAFCRGAGHCAKCDGSGERTAYKGWWKRKTLVRCNACDGSGRCPLCEGTGRPKGAASA